MKITEILTAAWGVITKLQAPAISTRRQISRAFIGAALALLPQTSVALPIGEFLEFR